MNQQQKLLDVIWNDDPKAIENSGFDVRGINIYQRNLLANAQRALQITFPTVFALLGSEAVDNLVFQFLQYSPPKQGDWSQWGDSFEHFLASRPIAQDYPYLPDCAALDWSMHCALHGKDVVLDQSSLQKLSTVDPNNITVECNPNVALIKSQYPITEIYNAHHHNNLLDRDAYMAKAKDMLSRELEQQTVIVFRPEFQPKLAKLTPSERDFMLCIKSGGSLTQSLEAVSNHRDFSFEQWLIIAIERNLIHYFKEV